MLAFKNTYYNVPEAVRLDLEKTLQATVDAWFATAQEIYRLQTEDRRFYNDADYYITKGKHRDGSVEWLLLDDISAGWWGILEWERPFNHDKGILDFRVHVKGGKRPKRNWKNWDKFEEEWGLGKCAIHLKARRLTPTAGWYDPAHTIELKHPLLLALDGAMLELGHEQKEIT